MTAAQARSDIGGASKGCKRAGARLPGVICHPRPKHMSAPKIPSARRSAASSPDLPEGMLHLAGYLDRTAQEALVEEVREVVRAAPFFSPMTPWGKPMRVRMTSAGRFGWYSDRRGYRYVEEHPGGTPWPPIPPSARRVWEAVSACPRAPECCLVNYYGEAATMGLHRDADEADVSAPVVSISLGDPATFRIGGLQRGGPTTSIRLHSGDVVVMGGASRLIHHGIGRIFFGQSDLLSQGGRINLTLRVVT